jgi:hypothetical protein
MILFVPKGNFWLLPRTFAYGSVQYSRIVQGRKTRQRRPKGEAGTIDRGVRKVKNAYIGADPPGVATRDKAELMQSKPLTKPREILAFTDTQAG